jgi:hypothetical protein
MKVTDPRRITTAKVNYTRKSAGYTWSDYKTNTDCEGVKHNPSLGKNTDPQKKLDTTYKEKASLKITHDNMKQHLKGR